MHGSADLPVKVELARKDQTYVNRVIRPRSWEVFRHQYRMLLRGIRVVRTLAETNKDTKTRREVHRSRT